MKQTNWRDSLDILMEKSLNELIKETKKYDGAIKNAQDKSKAQMWVAMAIINHKLNQLNPNYDKKLPKEELNKILDTLEKL